MKAKSRKRHNVASFDLFLPKWVNTCVSITLFTGDLMYKYVDGMCDL